MNKLQGVWRKIVKREYYSTRGMKSVILELECGHHQHRKMSREPKGNRVRCRWCAGDIPF